MAIIKASGSVSKTGILTLQNRKRLQDELIKLSGFAVEITIKKKARRSNPMNNYYWGVIVKEIELRMIELGNDVDADLVHEFLKDKFNKIEVIGEGGEIIDYRPGSTTEMNKEEMNIYWQKIWKWAAETLGISIPAPNEDLQFDFKKTG